MASKLSPSSRRAWIEIVVIIRGCVDDCQVALLAEGVDRNFRLGGRGRSRCVALLAEGVDRNCQLSSTYSERFRSPSSRRAWIEIPQSKSRARWRVCRPPRGGRG